MPQLATLYANRKLCVFSYDLKHMCQLFSPPHIFIVAHMMLCLTESKALWKSMKQLYIPSCHFSSPFLLTILWVIFGVLCFDAVRKVNAALHPNSSDMSIQSVDPLLACRARCKMLDQRFVDRADNFAAKLVWQGGLSRVAIDVRLASGFSNNNTGQQRI